jgi:hypothetical protein
MTDSLYEELMKESRERRAAHPGWPSHRPTFTPPGGPTQVLEEMPIGRLAGGRRGYCKYCYQTHQNWWLMDPRAFALGDEPELAAGQDAVLLCGECEYTYRASFAGIDPPFTLVGSA